VGEGDSLRRSGGQLRKRPFGVPRLMSTPMPGSTFASPSEENGAFKTTAGHTSSLLAEAELTLVDHLIVCLETAAGALVGLRSGHQAAVRY
jgi:hypothetical protein